MLFLCPFEKGSQETWEQQSRALVSSGLARKRRIEDSAQLNSPTRTTKMLAEKEQKTPDDLLGLAEDSDVDNANDTDDDERTKKLTQHHAKRRRVEQTRADDDDESDDAEDSEEEEESGAAIGPRFADKFDDPTPAPAKDEGDEGEGAEESSKLITHPSALKPLTPAQLALSKEATRKTGVVYLSRIPPFMKPQKVRDLLSRFGAINRVFLAPEDPKAHAKRVKFGGNKKRNFVEGWVEFVDKKEAKLCAETLNTQSVGGKKGNYYYDDVWNIKYLRKFKWHHLQAQVGGFLLLLV